MYVYFTFNVQQNLQFVTWVGVSTSIMQTQQNVLEKYAKMLLQVIPSVQGRKASRNVAMRRKHNALKSLHRLLRTNKPALITLTNILHNLYTMQKKISAWFKTKFNVKSKTDFMSFCTNCNSFDSWKSMIMRFDLTIPVGFWAIWNQGNWFYDALFLQTSLYFMPMENENIHSNSKDYRRFPTKWLE